VTCPVLLFAEDIRDLSGEPAEVQADWAKAFGSLGRAWADSTQTGRAHPHNKMRGRWHVAEISMSNRIAGVKFVQLRAYVDERGRFMETFRRSWFPERSWDIIQANCSYSRAGVLRGLHYHHRQVDYWFAPTGTLRVGLADLRPGSPTNGASQTLEIGEHNPVGVFIPIGVAHGFLALTDVALTYIVDNYYHGDDERGVAWNDPTLAVEWGVIEPIISARDRENPLMKDLPPDQVPPAYEV